MIKNLRQFVLYASRLGKDAANIAFHFDPKPVKKITATHSEHHFNPEEKIESSYRGGCEMETSDGRWWIYGCLKPLYDSSLRGRRSAPQL